MGKPVIWSVLPLRKRILLGGLFALAVAYIWALIIFGIYAAKEGWISGVPLVAGYAVLITCWFVFPIGAMIGAFMPHLIRNCSTRAAFVRGFLVGIGTGMVAAGLTIFIEQFASFMGRTTIVNPEAWQQAVLDRFVYFATTMIAICAPAVGGWALLWRRKMHPNESPHSLPATPPPVSATPAPDQSGRG